jgi:hypothetical protein
MRSRSRSRSRARSRSRSRSHARYHGFFGSLFDSAEQANLRRETNEYLQDQFAQGAGAAVLFTLVAKLLDAPRAQRKINRTVLTDLLDAMNYRELTSALNNAFQFQRGAVQRLLGDAEQARKMYTWLGGDRSGAANLRVLYDEFRKRRWRVKTLEPVAAERGYVMIMDAPVRARNLLSEL